MLVLKIRTMSLYAFYDLPTQKCFVLTKLLFTISVSSLVNSNLNRKNRSYAESKDLFVFIDKTGIMVISTYDCIISLLYVSTI